MRIQCYLSEDEMKIAIAKWFQSLGKDIEPNSVIINHCTADNRDSYGAFVSYYEEPKVKKTA